MVVALAHLRRRKGCSDTQSKDRPQLCLTAAIERESTSRRILACALARTELYAMVVGDGHGAGKASFEKKKKRKT